MLQSQELVTEQQQQSDQLTSRITGGLAPSSFLTFSMPSPNPESASTCWTQGRSPGSRSPSAVSQSESQPSVSQAVGSVPGWVLHHTALRNAVGSNGSRIQGWRTRQGSDERPIVDTLTFTVKASSGSLKLIHTLLPCLSWEAGGGLAGGATPGHLT